MSGPNGATKTILGRPQRFLRLLWSVVDPRAWAHLVKVVNYYNYTHVQPLREMKVGPFEGKGGIAPTASFAHGARIEIGARCLVSAGCHLWAGNGTARIVIGDDTLLAPDVMLVASNYRVHDGAPINRQAMQEADIVVGQDVWIGRGVTVLAGTRIGDGAVIAANSVVRGEIPPYAIAGGVPARVLGQRQIPSADMAAGP